MKYVVAAVPERESSVIEMQKAIPNLEVVWDEGRCAMHTFHRVLQAAGNSPTVLLQDDAELCDDFCAKAEEVISRKQLDVIQFFSMRQDDLKVGSRYDTGANYLMGQCWYAPAGFCAIYVKWIEFRGGIEKLKQNSFIGQTGDDAMTATFLKSMKAKYWIHVPNLVDHRVGKSIINPKRASTNRQSFTFKK